MTKYVALLRGIGPGNPNMRNEKLCKVFEDLGFLDVKSIISSGNIIFSSRKADTSEIEKTLEAVWPQKLGFTSTTIIRSQKQLEDLVTQKPFGDHQHNQKTYLTVTFLQEKPKTKISTPKGVGYKIVKQYDKEICSIVDTTLTKTPNLMLDLEKNFTKKITTRTWATVQKILKKME